MAGVEAFSPIFSQKNKGLYFLDIDAEIAYKLLHLSIKGQISSALFYCLTCKNRLEVKLKVR